MAGHFLNSIVRWSFWDVNINYTSAGVGLDNIYTHTVGWCGDTEAHETIFVALAVLLLEYMRSILKTKHSTFYSLRRAVGLLYRIYVLFRHLRGNERLQPKERSLCSNT